MDCANCIVSIFAVIIALVAWRLRARSVAKRDWLHARRIQRQEEIRLAKERFGEFLDSQEMSDMEQKSIINQSPASLIRQLRSRKLQPSRVLLAYQKQAYSIDKRLNCVVTFLQPDMSKVNLAGPLAGLPISVKECFNIHGVSCACGCSNWLDDVPTGDSSIVQSLMRVGAVPFVTTAVPQTMMTVLSSNPIDGTVRNPRDPERSPGGSSSGEAALIGAGGSPLGVGSDIGGSIRLPSAWCGIVGFKPTCGRLSYDNYRKIGVQKLVTSSWGPMSTDVETLSITMSAVSDLDQRQFDESLPPLDFDMSEATTKRRLKIGFFTFDGYFTAVPAAQRAVHVAKQRLEALGHKLVEWQPPPSEFFELYLRIVNCDCCQKLRDILVGDVTGDSIDYAIVPLAMSLWQRRLQLLRHWLLGDKDSQLWLSASLGCRSCYSMWLLNSRTLVAKQRLIDSWRAAGLDAVICPPVACPALPVHPKRSFLGALSYCFLFNLFNFPAGSVPIGRVTRTDLDNLDKFPASKSHWHSNVAAMQAGSEELPIAVQVATLPWRDELCLSVMQQLHQA